MRDASHINHPSRRDPRLVGRRVRFSCFSSWLVNAGRIVTSAKWISMPKWLYHSNARLKRPSPAVVASSAFMEAVKNESENLKTRQRLLEVAGEVFAEQGFKNATVREICKRAEANVAAINYHFG